MLNIKYKIIVKDGIDLEKVILIIFFFNNIIPIFAVNIELNFPNINNWKWRVFQ